MERAGDAQGRCNSIYAWPSTGCNSINASGWNSIYVGCRPSTCCNSTKRRYSTEVERHARGGSCFRVDGEAFQLSTGCSSTKRRFRKEGERHARRWTSSRFQAMPASAATPAPDWTAPEWTTRESCSGFHGRPASTERTTPVAHDSSAALQGNQMGRSGRRGRARSAGAPGGSAVSCGATFTEKGAPGAGGRRIFSDPRQRSREGGDCQYFARRSEKRTAQRDAVTAQKGAASAHMEIKERLVQRRHQREAGKAEQKPGAATAHLTFDQAGQGSVALLPPDEAAIVMLTKPTRLPDLVLQSPHEAKPSFHEDWTRVPGSAHDRELWEKELRLRDSRNKLIHETLRDGSCVWYTSTGSSMWPLVQAEDAILLHPIQAVTAEDGMDCRPKEASQIYVGDIVFCNVQRTQQYYAHIVLEIEYDVHARESRYWIGNIEQRHNGWCYREHIYGILIEVQVLWQGELLQLPIAQNCVP